MVGIITSSHFRDLVISNSETCGNTLGVIFISLAALTIEARSRAAPVFIASLELWDDSTTATIATYSRSCQPDDTATSKGAVYRTSLIRFYPCPPTYPSKIVPELREGLVDHRSPRKNCTE
jgi:hypothetical protein